jgi:uncharacterized protein YqgV (UPF0045/DUF77 family)
MIVAFSVSPSGGPSAGSLDPDAHGDSVHEAVAAAVVRASGLPNRTSSMFTEVEVEGEMARREDERKAA